MLRAKNRIEHGAIGKDGKNVLVVIEADQPVKGLPADVVKVLETSGAIYDDGRDGEPAKDDKS